MNIDQRIKQAVLTHHERVNGSGFPLQVMGDNINWISRILAVADTYDALTMCQGDKAGISAFEAIKKMEDEGYNRLDANYLMTFLKRIAETMIQRNVILNDGRMGRVVMINKYKLGTLLSISQNKAGIIFKRYLKSSGIVCYKENRKDGQRERRNLRTGRRLL